MFRFRTRFLAALVVCGGFAVLFVPQTLLAWGYTGHRVVGRIAERNLSPKALAAVHELLGPDPLAETATWADDERPNPAMQKFETWHYMNLEDGVALAEAPPNPAGDILRTLDSSKATLCDAQRSSDERRDALRWIAHLVGDLHQPLHVGKGSDRGGNDIVVLWFGEPSNLHEVWDSRMIEQTKLSFSEFVEFLDPPSPADLTAWRSGSFRDWAQESLDARASAYVIGNGRLGWPYQWTNMPLVEKRLYQAGVRLAATIEACLGK